MAPGSFHKTVDTTGVVDFDNDQATSVLAPFSGTGVAAAGLSPATSVKKGDPLAAVVSPDLPAAVSAYRKALVTAQNARKLADLDKDLLAHQGVSQREAEQAQTDAASAEADRDAALQALQSLGVDPQVISGHRQRQADRRAWKALIRSPLAGTVVEKLITPGQLLQAGTTPVFTVADLSRVWVMAHIFDSDLGLGASWATSPKSTGAASRNLQRHGGQYRRRGGPQHALRRGARGGRQSRRFSQEADVCPGPHPRPPGNATASWFRSPPSCATTRTCPLSMSPSPTAASRAQHVTLGYRSGDQYDIPSGLQPGQQVVADGALFVQFMQNQ